MRTGCTKGEARQKAAIRPCHDAFADADAMVKRVAMPLPSLWTVRKNAMQAFASAAKLVNPGRLMTQERIEAALARIADAAMRIDAATTRLHDRATSASETDPNDRAAVTAALAELDALLEQLQE